MDEDFQSIRRLSWDPNLTNVRWIFPTNECILVFIERFIQRKTNKTTKCYYWICCLWCCTTCHCYRNCIGYSA
jgi:hypothetical protein